MRDDATKFRTVVFAMQFQWQVPPTLAKRDGLHNFLRRWYLTSKNGGADYLLKEDVIQRWEDLRIQKTGRTVRAGAVIVTRSMSIRHHIACD